MKGLRLLLNLLVEVPDPTHDLLFIFILHVVQARHQENVTAPPFPPVLQSPHLLEVLNPGTRAGKEVDVVFWGDVAAVLPDFMKCT